MRLLARVLLSVLLFPAGVGFTEEPPPLEAFFEDPMLSHLALSPDGQQIAGRLTGEGHELIVVMDSSHPQIKSLMRLDDPGDSVQRLGWSGDGRIVGVAGRRLKGTGLVTRRTALFTVKSDGSGRRILRDKVSWMNQSPTPRELASTEVASRATRRFSRWRTSRSSLRLGVASVARRTSSKGGSLAAQRWSLSSVSATASTRAVPHGGGQRASRRSSRDSLSCFWGGAVHGWVLPRR